MSITTLSRRYRGLLVSVFSIGLFLILTPTVLAAPTDSCGSANDGKFVQTIETTTTRGTSVKTYVKWQCGYVTAGRGGQFSWTEVARQSTPFDGVPYDGSGGGGGITPAQCTSKGGSCSATCNGTSLGTCQDGTTCCQAAAGGGITPAQCTSKGGSCSNTCNGTSLGTCQDGTTCCQAGDGGNGGGGGGGWGSGGPTTITFANPLKYDTVQGVVESLLRYLQGIIVLLSLVFIVIGAVLYTTSTGNEEQIKMAKRAILAAMIGLAIGVAAPTFLREIADILLWKYEVPQDVSAAIRITRILANILSFLLGIVGILALIMLVVGGIAYLFSAGDEKRADTGKRIVKYAIIGITIALAGLVLVRQIALFFDS